MNGAAATPLEAQRISAGALERLTPDRPPGFGPAAASCLTKSQLVEGHAYDVSGRTTMVPVTFARLERVDGRTRLGTALDAGASYILFSGSGTYESGQQFSVTPDVFFGLGASAGVRDDSGSAGASIGLFGLVGFRSLALRLGWDFIANHFVLGVATKVDLLRVSPSTGGFLCPRERLLQ